MSLVLLTTSTSNTRQLQSVRNAVNERAKSLGVPDSKRSQAVGKAFSMLKLGSSPAWAVSEACRWLMGKEPTQHRGNPIPPAAA